MAQTRPEAHPSSPGSLPTTPLPAGLAGALRVPLRNRTTLAPGALPTPSWHQSTWAPITAALAALTSLLIKGALPIPLSPLPMRPR